MVAKQIKAVDAFATLMDPKKQIQWIAIRPPST
jgi:hypothetical protein